MTIMTKYVTIKIPRCLNESPSRVCSVFTLVGAFLQTWNKFYYDKKEINVLPDDHKCNIINAGTKIGNCIIGHCQNVRL